MRSAVKSKCAGKALQAVLVCRVFLIRRGDRTAVVVMLAELRERNLVEDGGFGDLVPRNRQQQRLQHQGIDRCRANQPSPEEPQFRASLV